MLFFELRFVFSSKARAKNIPITVIGSVSAEHQSSNVEIQTVWTMIEPSQLTLETSVAFSSDNDDSHTTSSQE
jgi:hypothetical protein